jgi:HlyD family type I secretion membrane fusion protein
LQAGRARTCQALYRLGLNRAEAQTRLAQARSRKASLAGQVAYAEIRAPQEGTVSALYLKTVGAVVQAGTVLAEIVPEEQGLTIRANLRPENVADVHLGQEARISLSAYDVSRYGSLEGVVQNVASNTTEREGQPPFYETIITVPDPTFTKTGQSAEIIPGMTVVVDIIGGKRSVLDYILTPINRATSVAVREN